MNHLKKYNESHYSVVDMDTIYDILRDVTDIGYLCRVENEWWSDEEHENRIGICIYGIDAGYSSYIGVDDISDPLQRLVGYLKTRGHFPEYATDEKIKYIKSVNDSAKKWNNENIELKLSKKIDKYNVIDLSWDEKKKMYMIDSNNISFHFKEN